LAILWAPIKFKSLYHRVGIAFVPILILLFNYFLKTMVFHVRFLEGTGGTAIKFDPHQFIHFMITGCANMLGFNAGPDYLSGLSLFEAGRTGYIIGGIFTVLMATLCIVYIYYRCRSKNKISFDWLRDILLFLALFVPLMASASITIRQEYRWLYAPYVVIIFTVAYLAGRIQGTKWLNWVLIICILISAVTVDTFYRGYLNNVFFMDGLKVADSARENIIVKYGSALTQKQLFLVGAHGDIKNWYFLDDKFFKFYTGDQQTHMNYVDDIQDIANYPLEKGKFIVFSVNLANREIIDITQQVETTLLDSSFKPVFDFLTNFKSGRINSTQKVDTPTGAGVFTMILPGDLGNKNTLVVISGFSYTFEKMVINNGDCLYFSAGTPLEGGDGARAYIEITSENGEMKRIFTTDLIPATKKGINWEPYFVSCNEYAGQKVKITFGVESPTGNSNADWIAFGSPLLLSQK
jgi:hypothetical protein